MDYPQQTDDSSHWEHRCDSGEPVLEYRYDRGELLSPVRLPNGTMVTEGFAAKEGVLSYRRADGSTRRELVTFDCLEKSLDSLSDLPLTLHHPDPEKYPDGVTPKNVDELGVGNTGEVVKLLNGGHTKVHIAIRRQDAIDAVEKEGVRELSLGYAVQLDNTPGTHPVHGPYDARQVRRIHNHLALVPRGRFGPEVGIRADAAYSTQTITGATTETSSTSSTGSTRNTSGGGRPHGVAVLTPKIARLAALLGVKHMDSDDQALDGSISLVEARNAADERAAKERKDADDTREREHKAALDRAVGEKDAEKRRADKAEADLENLRKEVAARADEAERADLEDMASHFEVDPSKHQDSKSLKRAIAGAYQGEELKADASDDYVAGLLKGARREFEAQQGRDDGAPFDGFEDHADEDDREDAVDGSGRADGQRAWRSQERPRNDSQGGQRGRRSDARPSLGRRMKDLYSGAASAASSANGSK